MTPLHGPSACSAHALIFPSGTSTYPKKARPRPTLPKRIPLPPQARVRDFVAKLCPERATAYCGRRPRAGVNEIEIDEYGRYRGLYQCNSSLLCPCCGPRLAEERGATIAEAIDNWAGMGGITSLITLTVRHGRREKLQDLLDGLQRAWDGFRRHMQFVLGPHGLAHYVRALEITVSSVGGWHPHLHVVAYHKTSFGPAIVKTLQQLWASCSVGAGLRRPSVRRGLAVNDAARAGRYTGKSVWSTTRPRSVQHGKVMYVPSVAQAPGADPATRTIRDLFEEAVMYRSRADLRRVREYARAVAGRSAVRWSHGALRALVHAPRAAKIIGRAIASLGSSCPSTWVPTRPRTIAIIAARPAKPLMTFNAVTSEITILSDHECVTDHDIVVASGVGDRLAERAAAIERRWPGTAQVLVDRYIARLRRAYAQRTFVPRAVTRWDVNRARDSIRRRLMSPRQRSGYGT